MRRIIKLFDARNVLVDGMCGSGKDILMANVVVRRNRPYVANINYGGDYHPLDFDAIDCGKNTYNDFLDGTLKHYEFPYPDGTDIYLSDCGVYFPSQYSGPLDKKYAHFPTFMALRRQLGECNVHANSQFVGRIWNKIREQSEQYIHCVGVCKWFLRLTGIVIQKVVVYERYESCEKRVPPFPLRRPLLNMERRFQWEMQYANYLISHGEIKPMILIYRNKSTYNTRRFKEMLEYA